MVKVQAQIVELESTLQKKRANILLRIRNEYDAAQRYERLLNTNYSTQLGLVAKQANKVSQYADLKREVDTTRQLYDSMFQKVTEAGLATAMHASDVRVIEQATTPKSPYKPSFLLNSGFGLMLGLSLGIVFVVQRSRSDRSIQGPGDTEFLNLPELGIIPAGLAGPSTRRALRTWDVNTKENIPERLELTTWQQQRSLLAESYRLTVTSILMSAQDDGHPRILVVSSANPGEGKTTVLSNLGIALAQANQRVLLIDGDMRKSRLHRIFGLDNKTGLGEVLTDVSLPSFQETHIPNLFVLTSGNSEDANLLLKPMLGSLLHRLKSQFNIILIDTPPMLSMPDARLFSRYADATILVVAQHTSRDAVGLACQKLSEDRSPVLGTILNNWDPKTSMHAYSKALNYYDAYYRHHGDPTV
jgi:capsular exopolysaccharide synthesis family protein